MILCPDDPRLQSKRETLPSNRTLAPRQESASVQAMESTVTFLHGDWLLIRSLIPEHASCPPQLMAPIRSGAGLQNSPGAGAGIMISIDVSAHDDIPVQWSLKSLVTSLRVTMAFRKPISPDTWISPTLVPLTIVSAHDSRPWQMICAPRDLPWILIALTPNAPESPAVNAMQFKQSTAWHIQQSYPISHFTNPGVDGPDAISVVVWHTALGLALHNWPNAPNAEPAGG